MSTLSNTVATGTKKKLDAESYKKEVQLALENIQQENHIEHDVPPIIKNTFESTEDYEYSGEDECQLFEREYTIPDKLKVVIQKNYATSEILFKNVLELGDTLNRIKDSWSSLDGAANWVIPTKDINKFCDGLKDTVCRLQQVSELFVPFQNEVTEKIKQTAIGGSKGKKNKIGMKHGINRKALYELKKLLGKISGIKKMVDSAVEHVFLFEEEISSRVEWVNFMKSEYFIIEAENVEWFKTKISKLYSKVYVLQEEYTCFFD